MTDAVASSTSAKESFLQKLEAWFKKLGGEIQTDLTDVFGSSVASSIESAAKGMLSTTLGAAAYEAVTAATDVETGKINIKQAAADVVTAAKTAGKTVGSSTVDLLLSVSRQALESKLGIKTSTA